MRLLDFVMCRNVFIYFDRAQQARIVDSFWNAMAPGAYLVIGRSEKMPTTEYARFEMINGRERIFRKPERRQ
jgi:chemotaxis protein methyltransferase CheR